MRILFSFICIVFLAAGSNAQSVLGLDEAVKIALQKNTSIKKMENDLTSLQSNIKTSFGNFLPSLSASTGWEWSRSEDDGGVRVINGVTIPVSKSVQESRSYFIGAGTDVTLFNGLANYATLEKAKNEMEVAKLNLQRIKQDVVFQTISYYYTVINAQKLLTVKEEDVKWNQGNLDLVTERNRLGFVTMADVYAQQVRLGNAELELLRATNNFETAKADLYYYLSLNISSDYKFPEELSGEIDGLDYTKDLADISQLVDQALKVRPDYLSAKLSLNSAANDITIAKSGHFPSLTGSARYNTYANKVNNLFNANNYSVGLSLNIPIFLGFEVENRIQFAQVVEMNRQIEIDDMTRVINRSIKQSLLDLQTSEKGLEVSKRNVIAADENRKIEEEKYKVGSSTLLNVLIANSEYVNASTTLINAQYSYIVLKEQLKYYLGVLDYKKFE